MVVPRCPYCPSTTFAVIRDGWTEAVRKARSNLKVAIQPQLRLIVCTGCGHSEWFVDPDAPDAHREVAHEIVHTGDEL